MTQPSMLVSHFPPTYTTRYIWLSCGAYCLMVVMGESDETLYSIWKTQENWTISLKSRDIIAFEGRCSSFLKSKLYVVEVSVICRKRSSCFRHSANLRIACKSMIIENDRIFPVKVMKWCGSDSAYPKTQNNNWCYQTT